MTLKEWLKDKPPWFKGVIYTFLTAIPLYFLFVLLGNLFPPLSFYWMIFQDFLLNNFRSIDGSCDVSFFPTCTFGLIDRLIFLLIITIIGGIVGFFIGRNKEKKGLSGEQTKEDLFLKNIARVWIILATILLILFILSSFGSFNEEKAEEYFNSAINNKDPSMCEKISSGVSIHSSSFSKDRCYYFLSQDTQDPSLCEKIKDGGYKIMCSNLFT